MCGQCLVGVWLVCGRCVVSMVGLVGVLLVVRVVRLVGLCGVVRGESSVLPPAHWKGLPILGIGH